MEGKNWQHTLLLYAPHCCASCDYTVFNTLHCPPSHYIALQCITFILQYIALHYNYISIEGGSSWDLQRGEATMACAVLSSPSVNAFFSFSCGSSSSLLSLRMKVKMQFTTLNMRNIPLNYPSCWISYIWGMKKKGFGSKHQVKGLM